MKAVLFGACGKMGRAVYEAARDEIVCGVDLAPQKMPFPVYQSAEEICEEADAAIDFSSPCGLKERLSFCEQKKLPLVLAVTGLSDADGEMIRKSAKKIPIAISSNFSVGIFVLNSLIKSAARALKDFDAEILEIHHREKKDAPSGTALLLKESLEKSFDGAQTVNILSVRGGSVFGVHEVLFLGEDETLTLSHSAQSRKVFAKGALLAARFLTGKEAGLYGAEDLYAPLLKGARIKCGNTFEGT